MSATAAFLFAVSSCATADTIVLKNGRSIEADHVTEDAAHVTYQTSAGELSIPRSIVARIDRNNFGSSSASHGAADALVSAPRIEPVPGYEDVERLAVHDQAVDSAYLARLESEAQSGTPASIARVAAAHHAAAQFLLGRGDTDAAISHYRHALIFAPDNLGLLLNLAILDIRENQFTAALDPLEHARRVAPDSADTAKLMGWAYYSSNKIDPAIDEWKRAERLRSDPEVERALEKAERDKSEEESYREGETAHFVLKYYGGAAPGLARGVLRVLEDDFRSLEAQLDYTPPEPISVILYTEQAFADITRAPGWVGALNDGRLRIPVRGLTDVTPDLARVLKHELTHCFINQLAAGRCPQWLNEGIAQAMEPKQVSNGRLLANLFQTQREIPFNVLEGSFMRFTPLQASLAYEESLATVQYISDTYGMSDLQRILERLGQGSSTEAALRATIHSDYGSLEGEVAKYLSGKYGN